MRLLCDSVSSCIKASFSAGLYKAAFKQAFLLLYGKASFSTANTQVSISPTFATLLQSFESFAKAVEKLVFSQEVDGSLHWAQSPNRWICHAATQLFQYITAL